MYVSKGSVTAAPTSKVLLAENERRNWFFVYNSGAATADNFCWLSLGAGAAVAVEGIPLPGGGFYECPVLERDRVACKEIQVICAGAGTPAITFHTQ